MQEGISELPAYGADDMTFVQEEEVFPVLPAVIPSLLPVHDDNDVEDEVEDVPGKKADSKPGGKRKLDDAEGAVKKVLLSHRSLYLLKSFLIKSSCALRKHQ